MGNAWTRIATRREGNDMWPLPPDYMELTDDGQRQARVNACAQWRVDWDTPEQAADAMEASVSFFDNYYLMPDPAEDFDPLFYDEDPVPDAPGHRQMIRDWGSCKATLHVAPRGFAKSSVVRKSVLPLVLTDHQYSVIYATSTASNAEFTGHKFKTQLRDNKRIQDDFSPEFPGGRIVPKRGEAAFGSANMYLRNGAWIQVISAESRQRGKRPSLYVLDDPEYDPRESTPMEVLRGYMDTLLFKLVRPMLTRPRKSVRWLATFVSRRHFAWYAMETVESKGVVRARDPRFDLWRRMLIRSEYVDANGKSRSCWPGMWPLTAAERDADPALKGRVSLEEIREEVGVPIYNSEYMGRPGEGSEAYFPEVTQEKHGWWVDKGDGEWGATSESRICWIGQDGQEKSESMRSLCDRSWVFMTVDTSFTSGPSSDYKVATVMAVNPENELFVLDMWSRQSDEDALIMGAFRLADQWRVRSIHPEIVQQSRNLFESMESIVKQRASDMTGTSWLPRIVPLKVGVAPKTSRIVTLYRRFAHGLIKMPLQLRWERPWSQLFDQIAQFNPMAKDGGLDKDDHIDTVAMNTLVLKGRPVRPYDEPLVSQDPMEMLMRGESRDRVTGVPHLARLDLMRLDLDTITGLLDARREPKGETRV